MVDDKVQATVKRQREVRMFAELSHANRILLENTEAEREGWFYECMATILMAAFKFEAYLNHVGKSLLPNWDKMDRLPHTKKLDHIRSHVGIAKMDGDRPFHTLADLFRFRNLVAHGRSEPLDPPEAIEVGTVEELRRKKPLTWWENLCTIEFAKRAYEDTEKIMEQIHSSAGFDVAELHRSGHSYTIKNRQEHC